MSNTMSAKILRHIADLHEAGIVADDATVDEEWAEWKKSSCDPVEHADFLIAYISFRVFDWANSNFNDFPAAIAKNQRRLDWMEANPDPTKTPIELWGDAKVALGDVDNELISKIRNGGAS